MYEKPYAKRIAFVLAVLAPAVSLLIRWPLQPILGDAVPHMTFFPAVLLAAYFGGFWPGLLSTVLGAIAANYFLTGQLSSLQITNANDLIALIIFVLVGTMISGLCESLHRARRRIVFDERREAEEARRQVDDRFRGTFENAAVGIAYCDPQGRFLRVNQKYCAIVGYSREELLTMAIHDVTHPDEIDRTRENLRRLIYGEIASYSEEKRHVCKDGSHTWIHISVSLQRDGKGAPSHTIGILQDISQRKRLEADLRESERRWRGLTEALPQFVWTADADGTSDYFSTQITQYTGRSESELLSWAWMDVLHPDDREPTRKSWMEAVAKQRDHEVEHRIRSSNGDYRWFTTRGVPIRDTGSRIVKWFGTCTDITEHKRTEQALRESEQRWRSLTEALPQLVWSASPDGACDYFSMQWTQHTGVPEDRLLGWQWMETLHPDDREPTRLFWTNSVAGRGPYDVEYRVRRTDGEYRWFKTRGVPIQDGEGRIVKWFGTCTDITDGKLAAEELRHAKEAAESANRAKDEFLANVSHEIRTPMNAILGMTDLVLATALSEDQRQSLKTAKAAADNLLSIINDLLDFSKIEAGKMELDSACFSLRTAVSDTVRTLAMRAHIKGLELISHVQSDLPDALIGDAGRLRQVLLNLVGNAIKFTNEGEVVLRVSADTDTKRHPDKQAPSGNDLPVSLAFEVRDTGIGIPPEKQERIFRAFEQEDTSTTRKYGGTGLGLTIAARLVALMGGTISVDSEPGRGSTFGFTALFGLLPHPPQPHAAAPPIQLYNLPVLIIDDNATNCHILEEWLRNWQMEPVAVRDGVAAMDTLWEAVSRRRPFPLVLLDARMPDTDGLVLAAKIRKRAELSTTCIILLTSGDMPGNLARLRELRIDAHLLKPAQQDELLETIYHVMNRAKDNVSLSGKDTSAERTSSQSIPPDVALNILVAEDNDFNAQLLEQLLVRRGHHVQLANDGRKALALAEEGVFDLLLLDVHMPELDGFQVIQGIRDRERSTGGHLPVVALTARSRKEDREHCLAAGMDDFLAKPIQVPDLWAAIDRVRSKDEGRRMKDEQEKTSASGSSFIPHPSSLLDARVLLAACGGDAAILEKICLALRTRLPDHIRVLQDAARQGNLARLQEEAHKLCGMVAAFSTVASEVASDLEDRAAEGQLDDARPLVEKLERMAQELVQQVDGLSIELLLQQAGPVDHSNPTARSPHSLDLPFHQT